MRHPANTSPRRSPRAALNAGTMPRNRNAARYRLVKNICAGHHRQWFMLTRTTRLMLLFLPLLLCHAVLADQVVQIMAIDEMAHEDSRYPQRGIETSQTRSRKASFQVWRSGPPFFPLPVSYWVGGTASNGVDYVALPGRVTIPAGKQFARIVVHPIDDAVPEWRRVGSNVVLTESVVLTVRPSSSYHVGPQRSAKVFIRDHLPTYTGSVGIIVNSVPISINDIPFVAVPIGQP